MKNIPLVFEVRCVPGKLNRLSQQHWVMISERKHQNGGGFVMTAYLTRKIKKDRKGRIPGFEKLNYIKHVAKNIGELSVKVMVA